MLPGTIYVHRDACVNRKLRLDRVMGRIRNIVPSIQVDCYRQEKKPISSVELAHGVWRNAISWSSVRTIGRYTKV
jgi:hypothetical protein